MYLLDTNVIAELRKAESRKIDQMVVVTRNVDDFAPIGVEIVNPWESTKSA